MITETTWHKKMFKYITKDYGLAISLGHMSMLAGWKIGCVRLSHTLSGNNNQIQHELHYTHLEMKAIEQRAAPGLQF